MGKAIVSIITLAYNHESYIKQCLDGFIMQKTTFPFEVIIHDDASTDSTASIIQGYQKAFPNIIKPVFQEKNQFSQGVQIGITYLYPKAQGKYIALCEGDDYWTDPYKLQKQVDFMDTHPEYTMCFGNAIEHWEDGEHPDRSFSSLEDRDYTGPEICWKWIVPTATVLFRKCVLASELYQTISLKRTIVGDLPLFLTCANLGKIHAFSDYFSVYRKQCSGFTMNYDSNRHLKMGSMWKNITKVFGPTYGEVSVYKAIFHFRKGLRAAKAEKNPSRYCKSLFEIIWMYLSRPINSGKRFRMILQQRNMV